MAKDTEKLIRQLSLISYLMAERRPVTATEIRRDVEGYSGMNEDAFARRFYADRAELDSLGIALSVDKPADGAAEQENYSLRPEQFYLPDIKFSDSELAALQTALSLLDGEFAYAEPLRLALQQISWGRPNPLGAPDQRSVALGLTASAGGHDLSQRLAKVETAIFRRKTITFEYHSLARDEVSQRKVDPYSLLFQGGQFYLVGKAHERDALRVFRLSRIRGKVAYATKAEHDFQRPTDFDPRAYASRSDWQLGDALGTAEVEVDSRVAWHIERHFGHYGEVTPGAADGSIVFATKYADARLLVAWVLGLGDHARLLGPPELEREARDRVDLIVARHTGDLALARKRRSSAANGAAEVAHTANGKRESGAIRPERFARLVTLASVLIAAGRSGERLRVDDVVDQLQITEHELREDVNVLNVVNFGGGSYVLYAEVLDDGHIEVDPEPYSDNFARPARLLPVQAKALVAAIDLIGDHIPEGSLASAREKIVRALGADPATEGLQVAAGGGDDAVIADIASRAIADHRVLELEYWKEAEDELSTRVVEPYGLMNSREGWYLHAWDRNRDAERSFRLDRIKGATAQEERFEPRPEVNTAALIEGWPRTGEVPASARARVWISPERARWTREERTVVAELSDGSIVVEIPFAGTDWLVREVLKEAGDAAVLEPPEAREAVRAAAAGLQ
ncbi:MAG TPA: WYL domain-containing protein [Solirubrobacteraceae bacterium]|nr:WYL domain-containing protein [Solirubrobacteraceae bacterium]